MKSKSSTSRPAISPARAAAFDILLRVERESSYAPELLHARTYASLTTVDHSLTTELVMGVLRWRSLLDSQILKSYLRPLSSLDLEVLIALRLALYQIGWLDRIPARAAIHESVELVKRARKRSAAPFVNAVLRKLSQSTSPGAHVIDATSARTLAASSAHPPWLVNRWVEMYGLDSTLRLCQHNQSVPVTAIRIRHAEAGGELEERLRAEGIEFTPGVLLRSTRRILRGDITKTAAFRSGLCVIQDEASQLVAALVGDSAHVLDCCAAPGGKTLAIADRNPDARILAVDLHLHRARLLKTLLTARDTASAGKRGPIRVVAADATRLPFAIKFDSVLADVPCSGTGTLARNPEIKWRLAPEDLAHLQARQLAILNSVMAQTAAGGRLIYSTCSLEKEENEDVVERALAQNSSFRVIDCRTELDRLTQKGELVWPDISSLTRGPYLRTIPGMHPCDGFFTAIVERT